VAERIYLFKRFERFWHWSQAALVITMMVTGFEVHGSYQLLGFKDAASIHTLAAWLLIGLWVFAIFWHFTTGEWRQYIPTSDQLGAVIRHYGYGIFLGRPHPYNVVPERKHNPLQRLAYLFLKLLINPLIWISGLAYLFYASWRDLVPAWFGLHDVALAHTLAAFMMLVFFIVHVYLTTTGATPLAHIKAMVTGWEDVH
jgi:thiosulfate reductase cytochrome b subunit